MAVFTPLSEAQIRDILADYDVGDYDSHEGILEGVENSNFHVHTTKGAHLILTVFEGRTNVNDLPFFFAYTDHLMGMGIPCPGPILNNKSEASVLVNGKRAALFPFLNGKALKAPEIRAEHCEDLGRFVARMHLAVSDFRMERENALSLAGWKKLADKTRAKADTVQAGLALLIDEELSYLEQNWPQHLARGAIHADIFPDNVFFQDDKVSAIIDFYFSATDMLAYDLAIVINAWCFDQDFKFRPDCYEALMNGYQSIRSLSFSEQDALPLLLRAASIRILVTRLHDWVFHDPESFVKPHDPLAYVARLKFHQAKKLAV
jgi:homoserine kinase type II